MSAKRVLIIESDLAALTFLGNMLIAAGYSVLGTQSGREGLIEAWRERPEMVIVVAELADISGLDVVRRLRADPRSSQARIIVLSGRSFPQDILAGVQAGADEYIVKRPGADAELLERVQALLPLQSAEAIVEDARPTGKIVAFFSAKGGTGTSSLCVNVAHLFAESVEPKTVAVVDMVLPIGSLHHIVGVETPDRTIIAASQLEPRHINAERMSLLMTQPDGWNFHILPGAPDPEAAQQLKVDRLEAVIGELHRMFDYVFIDFGRALSRISLPFIRQSSRIVLITSPDVATVSLTRIALNFFDTQDVRRNRIYLVLNRAVGLEGLSRPEMERVLGFPVRQLIPHMSGQFSMANNQHRPVSLKFPNDSVTYTLQEIAVMLSEQLAQTSPLAEEPELVAR